MCIRARPQGVVQPLGSLRRVDPARPAADGRRKIVSATVQSLRDDLLRVIRESGVELPADFDDDTSLIRSGLVDSTALFDVVLWVEDRIAPGLDLISLELSDEWDTVRKLLAFVGRHQPASA